MGVCAESRGGVDSMAESAARTKKEGLIVTYKELKTEFVRPSFRKRLNDELGQCCVNCGETENIEYHHIVPLSLGGTNNISNIVPLCARCHKAAHRGRNIAHYSNHGGSGRKSIASENKHSKIFDMFISGEIGNRKCTELTGYAGKTPITTRPVFKRYAKSKGIASVRNLIDVAATTRRLGLNEGDIVGEVKYLDGHIEKLQYRDTGQNDVEYVKRHAM